MAQAMKNVQNTYEDLGEESHYSSIATKEEFPEHFVEFPNQKQRNERKTKHSDDEDTFSSDYLPVYDHVNEINNINRAAVSNENRSLTDPNVLEIESASFPRQITKYKLLKCNFRKLSRTLLLISFLATFAGMAFIQFEIVEIKLDLTKHDQEQARSVQKIANLTNNDKSQDLKLQNVDSKMMEQNSLVQNLSDNHSKLLEKFEQSNKKHEQSALRMSSIESKVDANSNDIEKYKNDLTILFNNVSIVGKNVNAIDVRLNSSIDENQITNRSNFDKFRNIKSQLYEFRSKIEQTQKDLNVVDDQAAKNKNTASSNRNSVSELSSRQNLLENGLQNGPQKLKFEK